MQYPALRETLMAPGQELLQLAQDRWYTDQQAAAAEHTPEWHSLDEIVQRTVETHQIHPNGETSLPRSIQASLGREVLKAHFMNVDAKQIREAANLEREKAFFAYDEFLRSLVGQWASVKAHEGNLGEKAIYATGRRSGNVVQAEGVIHSSSAGDFIYLQPSRLIRWRVDEYEIRPIDMSTGKPAVDIFIEPIG